MTSIENLKKLLIIADMNDEFEEVDYHNYYQVLTDVRLDTIRYMERLMQDEPYYFKLYLPAKNAETAKISPETTLELVYFPFGVLNLPKRGRPFALSQYKALKPTQPADSPNMM